MAMAKHSPTCTQINPQNLLIIARTKTWLPSI